MVTVSPELVQGGSLQLDTSAVIVSVLVRLNEASEYVSVFKAEQHAKKDDSNLSVALCWCVDKIKYATHVVEIRLAHQRQN